LLRAVGSRLANVVRAPDLVARLGGDEFVVMARIPAPEAGALVGRLVGAFEHGFEIGGDEPWRQGCSVGVATFPGDAQGPGGLLDAADRAMYAAKAQGGGDAGERPVTGHAEKPARLAQRA
ncbi:MAG: GGDEF domain-containing protein, partial [Acidimicrobiales bacterium]